MHGLGTGVKWLASGTTSLTAVGTATDLDADAYKEANGMDAYVQVCKECAPMSLTNPCKPTSFTFGAPRKVVL